jgi:hypothetical protein
LLATRQAFDLLHAAQESAAGPVGRFDSYRLRNLKQLLNGNIGCSSKANCCFCKKPRLAVFIIGNHNLNRSHSTRQFFLAESTLYEVAPSGGPRHGAKPSRNLFPSSR